MKARAAALCLLLSLPVAAPAASEKTTIKVIVKNQYDKPVENAAVVLDFLGARDLSKMGIMKKRIHWEVKTNQQGIAHFPPVPEGTVQLQVITQKYQTYGKKLDVEGDDKTVDITLLPPQSQYSAHPPLKPKDEPKQ